MRMLFLAHLSHLSLTFLTFLRPKKKKEEKTTTFLSATVSSQILPAFSLWSCLWVWTSFPFVSIPQIVANCCKSPSTRHQTKTFPACAILLFSSTDFSSLHTSIPIWYNSANWNELQILGHPECQLCYACAVITVAVDL